MSATQTLPPRPSTSDVARMKVVAAVAVVVVVTLLGVASCTTALKKDAEAKVKDDLDLFSSSSSFSDLSPSELEESLDDDVRGERIFGYLTSTTTTRLTTSTLTALSTCLSVINNAPACTRRKRRASVMRDVKDEDIRDLSLNLEGSLSAVENLEDLSQQQRDFLRRDDRKITIWTTGFTTLTTTSYIAGTTVTATAYCVTPGLAAGCFGK
ncbi:uncharacterized protein LOC122264120 [Penaeus japonicus]|uniref:uncharacterized protein LOC122264120 n=1 Tax=Penaeus japonicus TaxID=27405 RepID=UPI001C70B81B|nr:uncharacterized protein LOC122264120 [Penaeus japonicus]